MKKTLSLLITLLLTIATFAYEAEINDIFYDFDHDKQTAIVSHDYFTYEEEDGLGEYSYTQTEIIIPEVVSYKGKEYQVTTIGESAFYYAQALKSVTLPKTINQIDKSAFYGCSSLEQIIIDENNPSFKSIDNILYNKEITTLLVCPATKTEVIIPNSVTKIGEGAFYYCTNL
ncbi:MAG: leucine-rich repeat domain-containing protein, partial [Paludibacteraceae bacterium]|nr:leucine-rich repeat domain-containing protein [Paludibacteraceae bacterium]